MTLSKSAIFLLLLQSLAHAADRYVAPSGVDAPGAGTLAAPWATIQYGADQLAAGDTLFVRGGTYSAGFTLSGRNGTASAPLTIRNYPGEFPVIDGGTLSATMPAGGITALVTLVNCSHVVVQGLDIYNYKTTDGTRIPAGIYIHGAGSDLRLVGNTVREIWQSSTTTGDGFGIAIYGDSAAAPLDGLILDGNTIHSLRTGSSESVTLNGNVTNFQVTNNVVHDCNNIGIDFIGYEQGSVADTVDFARNGLCSGNVVYNIDSQYNPAYGGNFDGIFVDQAARNATRAAPGLYVDGGASIVMERNVMYACNAGASIGSEHSGKFSNDVRFRNNLIRHNHIAGLFLGGATRNGNGGATNCVISNNTFYQNDLEHYGGGSVAIQHNVSTTTIKQNLFFASAEAGGWGQFVLKTSSAASSSFPANAIDWNLYTGTSAANNLEFIWNNTARSSFTSWQTNSGQDTHSSFTTASMAFANEASFDFRLTNTSPARDAGDPAFAAASGELDFGGQNRVANGRVDIGLDEQWLTWSEWRSLWFSLPNGGPGAEASDDPDQDGLPNLIEYSQGSAPTLQPSANAPKPNLTNGQWRFSYRRDGLEATYTIETSPDIIHWTPSTATETTDGTGLFWHEFPAGGSPLFMRLTVRLAVP